MGVSKGQLWRCRFGLKGSAGGCIKDRVSFKRPSAHWLPAHFQVVVLVVGKPVKDKRDLFDSCLTYLIQ
jgi:hypothetical protein